jgi:hypothetical protein
MWLKSLGYQNVLASSSRGARDGDHLVLQVREALSRAQQSAAKRPKLTPAPAPVAPPPPSVVSDFETELASGLSYSLASSHADVEEFISQEWRPSEVSAGRVDLTKDFLPDCGGTKVLAESTSPKVLVWLHDGSDATRIGFAGGTVQKGRRANFVTLERFYVVPSWRRSPQSATASGSIRPSHALLRQLLLEAARNHQCSVMELGTAISQSRVHLKFFESLQCFTHDQVNDHWTGTVDIYDALLRTLVASIRDRVGVRHLHKSKPIARTSKGIEPSDDDDDEQYDPEDYDEQCDEYGDQCGNPEVKFDASPPATTSAST